MVPHSILSQLLAWVTAVSFIALENNKYSYVLVLHSDTIFLEKVMGIPYDGELWFHCIAFGYNSF